MHIFIGIVLALAVGVFARWGGMDRDRAFYPTVMMVIAGLYVLFATLGDTPLTVLVTEGLIGTAFIALAFAGFKRSLWFVVVALAGHGLFDYIHPHAIHNPGVPVWWPDFCGAYDIAAAVFLGWRLHRDKPVSAEVCSDPATADMAGAQAGTPPIARE
jgi:hypothetical protein